MMRSRVSEMNTECCMCGDLGFSDQLFQCKVCQFRSQHRYCSNIYPKAESLGTCNWCLSQKEESSPNSSNSSSSHKNDGDGGAGDGEGKSKRSSIRKKGLINRGSGVLRSQLQLQKLPIKKKKSPEEEAAAAARSPPSPSVATSSPRRRVVTAGALEERLRRTKSEDIAMNRTSGGGGDGGGGGRQVFRNKVRRYKLLDEVSS